MALDPEELFEVDSDVPDLSGAVLLHHFDGFMDAGSAGSTLVDHLLETHEHRVIARFDVDDLIDYRGTPSHDDLRHRPLGGLRRPRAGRAPPARRGRHPVPADDRPRAGPAVGSRRRPPCAP